MGCMTSTCLPLSLHGEELEFLKSHTNYTEATIKKLYKSFLRDSPTGALSRDQFNKMFVLFNPSVNSQQFCSHAFRTFDMDSNGTIDFKEFLLAVNLSSSGDPEEKLKWAFRMCDIDGNGVIDLQEMTKIVEAIYEMLGSKSQTLGDTVEERAKVIFEEIDENKDGCVEEHEFLKGCIEDEDLWRILTVQTLERNQREMS